MPGNIDTMGVREFARQIGKSHTWVRKLIKTGVIPSNPDGTLSGNLAFPAYDKFIKGGNQDDAPMSEPIAKAMNVSEAFNKARLAEKTYQAKLKEIEYKLKRGDIVERDVVVQDAHKCAAAVRGQLMALPVRVSGLCEGRSSREIEEILEDALNEALAEFQKSEFL